MIFGNSQSWANNHKNTGFQHLEFCFEHIMLVGPQSSIPSSEISAQAEGVFGLGHAIHLHSGFGVFINIRPETEYGLELNNSLELRFGRNKYIGFLASVMHPLRTRNVEGMFGPLIRLETPELHSIIGAKTVALMFVYKTSLFEGGENNKEVQSHESSRMFGIVTQIAW
jgi:hypothetical protein